MLYATVLSVTVSDRKLMSLQMEEALHGWLACTQAAMQTCLGAYAHDPGADGPQAVCAHRSSVSLSTL